MSFKFNPTTGQLDLVDPMSSGSPVIGGDPNSVLFLESTSTLQTDPVFTYIESPQPGVDEAYLNVLETSVRSGIDVGTALFATKSSLISSDTLSPNNDGTISYGAAYNYFQFSGSVSVNGAVLSDYKSACGNQLVLSGSYTIDNGSSDYNLLLTGASNSTNAPNIIISASTDSPNISLYGSYNTASGSVTNNGTGTPIIKYVGVYAAGIRSAGATGTESVGGEFLGSNSTTNYGIKTTGTTAGVYSTGHYLVSSANTYDFGSATNYARHVYSTSLTMANATTNTTGISLGGDVRLYRSAADTLRVEDKIHASPPTNTATSGTFQGILCQVNSAPSASSTSRNWGLQFAVAATNSQNHTDGTGGLVGFEGYARNESTGTVTREVGGLVYCDNTAAGNVSTAIVYHGFNSTSHASAVTADATIFRASAGTQTGATTAWYGFRADAPALTANNQTRVGLRLGAMPAIGAFTGITTNVAINIEGTSRLPQDGVRIADTNLYSSAADTLKTDDSFHVGANFRHLGTNLGFYNVAAVARATTGIAAAAFVANTSGIANDSATYGGYSGGQIAAALIAVGILT